MDLTMLIQFFHYSMVRCEICKSPLLFLIFSGFVELHQRRWNDRFCMSVHDECEIKHPSSVTRQRNFRPLIADTDKWDEILAWHAGPSPLANIGCDIYSILSRQTVFTRHSLCSRTTVKPKFLSVLRSIMLDMLSRLTLLTTKQNGWKLP